MRASDYFKDFSQNLKGHGIDEHHALFREILHSQGFKNTSVLADKTLNSSQIKEFHKIITELNTGKPLQQVLGVSPFYGLDFKVNEHVLIPRPETEELVHLILTENSDNQQMILDLGTGSGCIPISLLFNRTTWKSIAIDKSTEAIEIAQSNTINHRLGDRLELRQEDMLHSFPSLDHIDILVSNPPYIANFEKEKMEDKVLKFEPNMALFTGTDDPLLFYKRIAEEIKNQNFSGKSYFEINPIYREELSVIFDAFQIKFRNDMQKTTRFMLLT